MKILFINPNRYHFPPVVPIGIEYLAGELAKTKHTFDVCDLCFSNDPKSDIQLAISKLKPDIIGITIRQIDTVLYQNNEFFLPEIKEYITECKKLDCKVILGGAGFSIMPAEILEYTGADYGIVGPGELALVRFLNMLEQNYELPKIINGFDYFQDSEYRFSRKPLFDYNKYIENDGIAGFRTQIGCNENCIFCTEAKKKIIFHDPDSVGREIASIKEFGIERFHLCDSEFNLNIEHSIAVCKSIVKHNHKIDWTLYMKPKPVTEELFTWLKKTGANSTTLSINTVNADYKSIQEFCRYAEKNEIKIAADISTGFPGENIDSLYKMIDVLELLPVTTAGINSFYRIYPNTGLYFQILKNKKMKDFLINYKSNDSFLEPVFYNFFTEEMIRKAIGNKKKFRIEGFEKATNYQRIG
ncbi:MAG: cobalamin-dependent protein [Bacteroidales bacterium]|nr:cobalamin-dependent protein [Bacteroidales bacterium]